MPPLNALYGGRRRSSPPALVSCRRAAVARRPFGADAAARYSGHALLQHRDRTLREGLEQTRAYMDRSGAAEGHLVVFDRTEGRSWNEKIFRRDEAEGGTPCRPDFRAEH